MAAAWRSRSRRERVAILGMTVLGVALLALSVAHFVSDVPGLLLLVALVAVITGLAIMGVRAYKHPARLTGILVTAVTILVALLTPVLRAAPSNTVEASPPATRSLSSGPPTAASATSPAAVPADGSLVTSYRVANGAGSTDKVVVPGGTVLQPFRAASEVLSQATVVAGCNPGFGQPCPRDGYYFGDIMVSVLDGANVLATVKARTRNNQDAIADLRTLRVQPGKWYVLQVRNVTGRHVGFYFRPYSGQASVTVHGANEPYDEGRLDQVLAASITGPA